MIIAITNQKGGTGKTTTAAAIASGLSSLMGLKTLLVDLDPQCNLSYAVGADTSGATSLGAIIGEVTAEQAIQHTEAGDIIPASRQLSGADAVITQTGKEYRLREALDGIRDRYDYIIIDTPPALGILTVNALTACQTVIVPAQADIFSLQGIEQLAETISPVKRYCNPALTISGILLTRYSNRSVLSREVMDLAQTLAGKLGTTVYRTTIREGIAVKEAQISRQSLFEYAPRAKVTEDYTAFVRELISQQKEREKQ